MFVNGKERHNQRRIPKRLMWRLWHTPTRGAAGMGLKDSFGSTYLIRPDGSIKLIHKEKHEFKGSALSSVQRDSGTGSRAGGPHLPPSASSPCKSQCAVPA